MFNILSNIKILYLFVDFIRDIRKLFDITNIFSNIFENILLNAIELFKQI